MPREGDCLLQIEHGLRARIGPPARTFEEPHASEYFGPHAWYIGTFADFRRGPQVSDAGAEQRVDADVSGPHHPCGEKR